MSIFGGFLMETCDDFCFPLRTGAIRARLRKPFLCSAIQFVGCDDDSHACCSDAPVPHEQNKAKNRAEISYEKKLHRIPTAEANRKNDSNRELLRFG